MDNVKSMFIVGLVLAIVSISFSSLMSELATVKPNLEKILTK